MMPLIVHLILSWPGGAKQGLMMYHHIYCNCFTTNFEEVSAAGGHAKFVMLVNAVQIEESDEL